MKNKRIVENDKTKIFSAMLELDLKKNKALNLTWRQACLTVVESCTSSTSSRSARHLAPLEGKSERAEQRP
ncbi:unnamed protein product [Lampetra fluviatilis]